MIITCTCRHEYQDSKYGIGKRIATKMKKEGMFRCTVCKKEHQISAEKEKNELNGEKK